MSIHIYTKVRAMESNLGPGGIPRLVPKKKDKKKENASLKM